MNENVGAIQSVAVSELKDPELFFCLCRVSLYISPRGVSMCVQGRERERERWRKRCPVMCWHLHQLFCSPAYPGEAPGSTVATEDK